MSEAKTDLLSRLIEADRQYHSRKAAGMPAHRDERGVEVGPINGVHPSTARALAEAGLIELLGVGANDHPHAFLGRYEPYDACEECAEPLHAPSVHLYDPKASGFHIKSPCGRTYFVPRQVVLQDYAEFLHEQDRLPMDAALEKAGADPDFLDTWFHEQFAWIDVERLGRMTADADANAVKTALDFYRNYVGASPASDVVVVP